MRNWPSWECTDSCEAPDVKTWLAKLTLEQLGDLYVMTTFEMQNRGFTIPDRLAPQAEIEKFAAELEHICNPEMQS